MTETQKTFNRKCRFCEKPFTVLKRSSKRRYCDNKCARAYRKRLREEEDELRNEPVLTEELKDVPPKGYIELKVNSEKRTKPLQITFLCNTCIVNKYNPITKKLIVPNHQLLGTYHGQCPECKRDQAFNTNLSPNMRAFVRLPEKGEPPFDDTDIKACKQIYKHHALIARDR